MISVNRMTPFNDLREHVRSWLSEELIFSYELSCSVTPAGLVLTLYQQQTDFSVAITLHPSPDCLLISRFILNDEKRLERLCQSLYDAALIEIVLQSLTLLAFFAQRFNKSEINFMLVEEEADDLICFESLFHAISSHMTNGGKRQLLTLVIDKSFFEIMKRWKMQLKQQLWSYQKNNRLVTTYFQSISQNKRIALKGLWSSFPQQKTTKNIITFPPQYSHQTFN
ncbi:MAG: hypothetical protein K0M45_08110 [Candidatus Paracaedibacteraceae bacterium]|nr:hypothetical protein [Candidatus Paracaedibacteraceae bacterium]